MTKLAPKDGDSGDRFGRAVAVSDDGTTAVVTAYEDEDPNGSAAGSAYVFSSAGGSWKQRAKLAACDGDSGDGFGRSVAVSADGTTAIVGAFGDDDPNGEHAGSTYVFTGAGDSWEQEAKLAADDGNPGDGFGGAIAVSSDGRSAVVGSSSDEVATGANVGSAYVFSQVGPSWNQQARHIAYDADHEDSFGGSVAVSGDGSLAVVGAPGDDDPNGEKAGAAYVVE